MTWSSPTSARISAVLSSTNEPAVQSPRQPQTVSTKLASIRAPCSVCTTSGWNCVPNTSASPVAGVLANAATPALSVEATAWKPAGSSVMWSPWLIQTVEPSGTPSRSGVGAWAARRARPNSRRSEASTVPPKARAMAWSP